MRQQYYKHDYFQIIDNYLKIFICSRIIIIIILYKYIIQPLQMVLTYIIIITEIKLNYYELKYITFVINT